MCTTPPARSTTQHPNLSLLLPTFSCLAVPLQSSFASLHHAEPLSVVAASLLSSVPLSHSCSLFLSSPAFPILISLSFFLISYLSFSNLPIFLSAAGPGCLACTTQIQHLESPPFQAGTREKCMQTQTFSSTSIHNLRTRTPHFVRYSRAVFQITILCSRQL